MAATGGGQDKKDDGVIRRLAKGAAFDAVKDGLKLGLIWLASTLLAPLVPLVVAYFFDDTVGRDPSGAWSWTQFYTDLFESPEPGTPLDFLFGKWWRTALIFAGVGLVITLLRLIFRYYQQIKVYLQNFADAEQAFETIGFHSVSRPDEAARSWKVLLDDIKDPRTQTLLILGANGWETFGAESSPLHDVLQKFAGEVRVLLVDTKNRHLETRAGSVNARASDYRKHIQDSEALLNKLKARGAKVDLRFYAEPTSWKLIITPNFCWVQYYSHNAHVHETPVYLFYNSAHGSSLYHRFHWEFSRVWNACPPRRNGRKRT
jgi:hypothetical protein